MIVLAAACVPDVSVLLINRWVQGQRPDPRRCAQEGHVADRERRAIKTVDQGGAGLKEAWMMGGLSDQAA